MSNLKGDLKNEIQKLIGKECWAVIAGKGRGSNVDLRIGEKLPMKEPINNLSISEDARKYDSEYALFILCTWRIDNDEKVVCGSWDYNLENGKMLKGLNLLIGNKILDSYLTEPALDLTLRFSSNINIKIFCDQTNEKDDYDNYDLFTPTEIITVGSQSILKSEPREFD